MSCTSARNEIPNDVNIHRFSWSLNSTESSSTIQTSFDTENSMAASKTDSNCSSNCIADTKVISYTNDSKVIQLNSQTRLVPMSIDTGSNMAAQKPLVYTTRTVLRCSAAEGKFIHFSSSSQHTFA